MGRALGGVLLPYSRFVPASWEKDRGAATLISQEWVFLHLARVAVVAPVMAPGRTRQGLFAGGVGEWMLGYGRMALSLGMLRGVGRTSEAPGDTHDQSRGERDRGKETLERFDVKGVEVDEMYPEGFRNLLKGRQ